MVSHVNIGTPQGSILSPLLFLIFINDIVNCSDVLCFNLFADDTCVYLNHQNLSTLYSLMNVELGKVGAWIEANKLSLNVNKSVYLLFSGRKYLPNQLPVLSIVNKPICIATETKFLGIFIDCKLNWKVHAAYVYSKVSRMVGVFYKVKKLLTLPALKTLYHSLVYPHLQYGIIFWGAVNVVDFNKIFRAQKKLIRFIDGAARLAHTEPLFKQHKILKLEDIKKLEMCKFIYSDINFGHRFNFSARNRIHSHNTRNNHSINLPQPRINVIKYSVFYSGLQLFNNIPTLLKNSDSKASFKINLKLSILDSYEIS